MTRLGERGRRGLSLPARAAMDAAGLLAGGALGAVAAVRRGKAVHPHGAVHAARLVAEGAPAAPPASALLSTPGEHRALVRFSRSLGLPRPLPDLLGMSIRVLDAYGHGRHQDFLLVTSADLPVLHHVFLPAGDVQQRPYSSSRPYRSGDRLLIVGALPDPSSPRPAGGDELERLARAATTGRLRFRLAVATPGGRFAPVAGRHVGDRMGDALDALRFNPFNAGDGLQPAGTLSRLRDYAYPMSQRAWALTRGASAQERAEVGLAAALRATNDGRDTAS